MAKSAVNEAKTKRIKVGLFRPISLWPFPSQELLALQKKKNLNICFVLKMNMGQMVEDVKLAVNGTIPVTFYGRTGGCIPSPEEIIKEIITLDKNIRKGEQVVIYRRTKGLTQKETHYCPGCTHGIVHKIVGEVLEELDMLGKTVGVASVGCSVMAYDYFNCDMVQALTVVHRLWQPV